MNWSNIQELSKWIKWVLENRPNATATDIETILLEKVKSMGLISSSKTAFPYCFPEYSAAEVGKPRGGTTLQQSVRK
jgi:hypothetical protein